MDQSSFTNLSLPSYRKTPCTPKIEQDFKGLKIAMPKNLTISVDVEIPLCGIYRVPSSFMAKVQGDLLEQTLIVFKNIETLEVFSFDLRPDKEPVKSSIEPSKSQSGNNISVEDEYIEIQFFNIDVRNFYPDFPLQKSKYLVYASQKDIKSNTLQISIEE